MENNIESNINNVSVIASVQPKEGWFKYSLYLSLILLQGLTLLVFRGSLGDYDNKIFGMSVKFFVLVDFIVLIYWIFASIIKKIIINRNEFYKCIFIPAAIFYLYFLIYNFVSFKENAPLGLFLGSMFFLIFIILFTILNFIIYMGLNYVVKNTNKKADVLIENLENKKINKLWNDALRVFILFLIMIIPLILKRLL